MADLLNPLLPLEKETIKRLFLFEEAVVVAGKEMNPSVIANYVYDLAKVYNQFYQELPVLKEENVEKALLRLAVTSMAGEVIRRSMNAWTEENFSGSARACGLRAVQSHSIPLERVPRNATNRRSSPSLFQMTRRRLDAASAAPSAAPRAASAEPASIAAVPATVETKFRLVMFWEAGIGCTTGQRRQKRAFMPHDISAFSRL